MATNVPQAFKIKPITNSTLLRTNSKIYTLSNTTVSDFDFYQQKSVYNKYQKRL